MKEIRLTGMYSALVALVDNEDYERLATLPWYYTNGYAKTSVRHGGQLMHRMIMRTPTHLVTDHINGDRLDNRRANLRRCRQQTNMRNSHRALHRRAA